MTQRIKIRKQSATVGLYTDGFRPRQIAVPEIWWWRCPTHNAKGTHAEALAAALTHANNAHPPEQPC